MPLKIDLQFLALLFCISFLTPVNAKTIKIEAGDYDRIEVPVTCPVPESIPNNHPFILISNDTNQRIAISIQMAILHPQPCETGKTRKLKNAGDARWDTLMYSV